MSRIITKVTVVDPVKRAKALAHEIEYALPAIGLRRHRGYRALDELVQLVQELARDDDPALNTQSGSE